MYMQFQDGRLPPASSAELIKYMDKTPQTGSTIEFQSPDIELSTNSSQWGICCA